MPNIVPLLDILILSRHINHILLKPIPIRIHDRIQLLRPLIRKDAPPKHLIRIQRVIRKSIPLHHPKRIIRRFRIPIRVTKRLGAIQRIITRAVIGHVDILLGNERSIHVEQSIVRHEGIRIGQSFQLGTFPYAHSAAVVVDVVQVRIVCHVDVALVGSADIAVVIEGVEYESIVSILHAVYAEAGHGDPHAEEEEGAEDVGHATVGGGAVEVGWGG
mmetsp:Transcript_37389/g.78326  ORF Transcript_37389/g.78326 Transcript_37389/m.78326 type:complete len:217 (-) Transcript_37389:474-1124(-)